MLLCQIWGITAAAGTAPIAALSVLSVTWQQGDHATVAVYTYSNPSDHSIWPCCCRCCRRTTQLSSCPSDHLEQLHFNATCNTAPYYPHPMHKQLYCLLTTACGPPAAAAGTPYNFRVPTGSAIPTAANTSTNLSPLVPRLL